LLQNLRQLSCTIVYVSGRKDLENYFDRVIYLG